MGRFIFGIVKRSLMLTVMIVMVSVVLIHEGVSITVHDPISYGKAIEMASTSSKTLTGITEVSTKVGDALKTANKSLSELSTLNSVMGSPLPNSFMSKLSNMKTMSRKYGGLLGALSGTASGSHASAYSFNQKAKSTFGTPDVSKFLRAKDYIESKYYAETGKPVHVNHARKIRIAREKSARKSVVTTLAVAKTHKKDLAEDHKELERLAQEASDSGDMNHHMVMQTKYLERIAQSLEKLVLLQSQSLEFKAKTYLGDRGVDVRSQDESDPNDQKADQNPYQDSYKAPNQQSYSFQNTNKQTNNAQTNSARGGFFR